MEILKKVREVIKKRTNEKIEVVKNNATVLLVVWHGI
jgi:hypothetical protein